MLTDAIEARGFGVALRDFLAQRGGLEHFDPRPHAHYPVRQLGRALDGHRHERRTVATTRETLAAMNRARTNIRLGLFAVNLQLDFGLGPIDDSESPFGVCRRIEAARENESRRSAVWLANKFYRADSLDREINDRVAAMTVADQIETAAIGNQRVRVEIVLMALAGQARVIDREPALVEQRAQDHVELFAEIGVIFGRVRDGVKLALEVGQPRLLRQAQVAIHLLPQALDAFLQHCAFEELEHSQREIQQRDLLRGRLRSFHRADQAEFALVTGADNFNQRFAMPVEQVAAQHRHVTGKRALGNLEALGDRFETPAVRLRE